MPKHIQASLRRELAVKASVDPETIDKALRGEPIKGLSGERARAALKDAGLIPHDAPAPEWFPPGSGRRA